MSDLKAYILCRFAEKSGIYSWIKESPVPCVVVDEYLHDWPVPEDAGVVITHMHYRWEEINCLRGIYETGKVPVLVLADGILEYRNTWEHPDLASGSIFQPVMGHKLACIGRGQARIVESWGNLGKCEIVGLPRFDETPRVDYTNIEVNKEGPFRVLIVTANTPAFDQKQRDAVIESLSHIKNRIDTNNKVNGRPVEFVWRLTDGLHDEIGVHQEMDPELITPLSDEIDGVDAVITTPSTVYLESVLKGRPTAILDFHNSPQYISAAWTINAPKHFNWILQELETPPQAKMMFQESVLLDQLECRTPATPRMTELVAEMVEGRRRVLADGQPVAFPHRILNDPQNGLASIPSTFDPQSLYPEKLFKDADVTRLQVELNQALKRLDTLPIELQEKNKMLSEAIEIVQKQKMRISRMFNKMTDMHARIIDLRERLGIFKPEDAAAKEAMKKESEKNP